MISKVVHVCDDNDVMSWELNNNWEWWVIRKLTVEVCVCDSNKIYRGLVSFKNDEIKLTVSKYSKLRVYSVDF